MKIIFYGTPEFAVPSLDILRKNGLEVLAVVTAPDKPSGRGLKINVSAVKKYALEHHLKVLQPVKLSEETFVQELTSLAPDLQVIVAFRKMPEIIWSLPRLGSFNLHGSLLPQYRGAAPIQRAVMNGELETGVTTFFLQQEIDTGKIIYNERIPIRKDENAGELHDRMMTIGAALVLKTIRAIESGKYPSVNQSDLIMNDSILKEAPKIKKEDCRINWNKNETDISNLVRGLSPHPGAFTYLHGPAGENLILKIYQAKPFITAEKPGKPGRMMTDSSAYLQIFCGENALDLTEVQLEGKKRMPVVDFLRGTRLNDQWYVS